MTLTARERAKRCEFDADYRKAAQPALRSIERRVCGCDYGATSWATKDEADHLADMLGLRPGLRMLEIGAGSGWPALYVAAKTGCDAILTDLPLDGLRIAARRAAADRLSDSTTVTVADATQLPFADHRFDAINHSDVLCCLIRKRELLSECQRIIRPGGRMAFSVIYVPAGLTTKDYALAVAAAPEFVETDVDYPALLDTTGWSLLQRYDLTVSFAQSCKSRLRIEREERNALLAVIDPSELDEHWRRLRDRIDALGRGILKRALFLAAPPNRDA